MAIRSCKGKKDVKPNLYVSLDIIPEIGMNKSKPQSKYAKNRLLHDQISSKWSKMVINGQNYRKWVKISKNFYK